MGDGFEYFRDHHVENMERMFAAVSDLYARYWDDFFHFAIHEDPGESRERAFERTHRRYMEALRIERARSAADLACGRGGFANVLAHHAAGTVLGIDVSPAQLAQCRRFQRPNLAFRRHDIMRVHELGQRFDAVSFLDADCYLPDKGLAVERIASVLEPGGRFLLLAWCKRDGLNALQEELVLHPFMRAWGVPGLETPSGYRRHFARAGLRLLEESDLNEAVRPNWDYGYRRAVEGVAELSAADLPRFLWQGVVQGPDSLRLVKEQFAAALYIKAGFDAGFLRYVLFLAEKA
ncbi:SAM-dependent methyltransferase [Arenibaculum sp.]|jgi:tocopherol O-methyltransferase|uniref:SAM-dependent methyltransferase n=1 Tax=Arenibaculum sp. TaxID=2865862 RepID=UPI002E105A61|nr:methyltransferase domain-containing protein [Arenibaculum sp.]